MVILTAQGNFLLQFLFDNDDDDDNIDFWNDEHPYLQPTNQA